MPSIIGTSIENYYLFSQLKVHTERVTFVWWEDLTTGRVGWRYSRTEHGELSVTLSGRSMMLGLSVDSCNMLQEVVCLQMFRQDQEHMSLT